MPAAKPKWPPIIRTGAEADALEDKENYFEQLDPSVADRYIGECQHYACNDPAVGRLCIKHEIAFWGIFGATSNESPLADMSLIWVLAEVEE